MKDQGLLCHGFAFSSKGLLVPKVAFEGKLFPISESETFLGLFIFRIMLQCELSTIAGIVLLFGI
jgi:hypothetical protein